MNHTRTLLVIICLGLLLGSASPADVPRPFTADNCLDGQIPVYRIVSGQGSWKCEDAPSGTSFPLFAPNGSASAPSYSFTNETSTGITLTGSNILGFYINGTRRMDLRSNADLFLLGDAATVRLGANADAGIVYSAIGVTSARSSEGADTGWFTDAGIKRVSSQFDKTTNTTLADVNGLSVSLQVGRTYTFDVNLFVNADATGGSKYAIAGSATATNIIYYINQICDASGLNTITSRQTALGGSAGQAGCVAALVKIHGTITVSVAGTLTVQFAQNTANGTSSVLVGSSFIVRDNP